MEYNILRSNKVGNKEHFSRNVADKLYRYEYKYTYRVKSREYSFEACIKVSLVCQCKSKYEEEKTSKDVVRIYILHGIPQWCFSVVWMLERVEVWIKKRAKRQGTGWNGPF